ncbi:Uncharacterized protein dnl_02000 [Desulfonema limicola]|uniref:Uncharacterized protein n=1 Tax=Desulfonema limicola TaxID=45656 RepID=A0A975B3A0_9BACT|nr:hypothetical protein [Desulfonema limicola]QTA77995.1 Uncharacterized protein dnl_02000 [Desulfonema limicola]
MFNEFSDHKTIKKSFAWIKKNLDPLQSYIVFENDLNKQDYSIFSESLIAYQYLKNGNYAWKKIYDSKYSKEYLVIQIEPGKEDETLGRVIGYGFPADTVYYLYKAEKKL